MEITDRPEEFTAEPAGFDARNCDRYPSLISSTNYGVSESNAFKICRWVEDTLIKDKCFALPGRKALLKGDIKYEVILVDASESPVERPKKTASLLLTLKQAYEILNCHANTLRAWNAKSYLVAVLFSTRGDRRYRKEDVRQTLETTSLKLAGSTTSISGLTIKSFQH